MSAITEKVDAIFSEWDKPDSPGCALAVIQDGEIIYKCGYGMADLERNVPITSESLFDIGSSGKQFTTTVIAILENRGLLSFDDSLRKYVPEMPVYADEITLRHLIHHTSGLRDYVTLMMMAGLPFENFYPEEALLDLIAQQKELNFSPGEEYAYSNSGYFMLGIVVERVAGKHLTELIREYIYEPLGMLHSGFNKDHRPILKNRALSYAPTENGFQNEVALCGGFGDGAIYSSVEDLFLWDQNFYANKLNDAQPDLLKTLHTQGKLNDGNTIKYAFGLKIEPYRGLRIVSHGGSWAGYRSELLRFPEQHFSVICLCNLASMEPEDLARRVADIYLEAELSGPIPKEEEKQPVHESSDYIPDSLELYTGQYHSPELNTDYILTIHDDQLYLQRNRFAQPEPLLPVAPTSFRANRLEIRFSDQGLFVAQGRVKNIRFEKL